MKKSHEESSNGCENSTNGSSMSKNPWLGFYGTSIGQTVKKLGLLHFSPSSFAGTSSTIRTLVHMNLGHAPKMHFNLALGATVPTVQTVGRLGCLQPPTASALGHMHHVTIDWAQRSFDRFQNRATDVTSRASYNRAQYNV
jgi:hypothetical protein